MPKTFNVPSTPQEALKRLKSTITKWSRQEDLVTDEVTGAKKLIKYLEGYVSVVEKVETSVEKENV